MYRLHIDYGNSLTADGEYESLDEAMTVAEQDARGLGLEIFWGRDQNENSDEVYTADRHGVSYTITIAAI